MQVKVEAGRPGRVEHCRISGTLAFSTASLPMELPHMDGRFTHHLFPSNDNITYDHVPRASDGPNESVSSDANGMPAAKFYPDKK